MYLGRMFNAFVTPVAGWRPPLPVIPQRTRLPDEPVKPDWRELAYDENWEGAILAYLREDWRKTHKLWTVVNTVVAESRQPSRFDVRAATWECLQEMMRLRRERRVFRYKRQTVAILDPDLVVPLLKPRIAASNGRRLGN